MLYKYLPLDSLSVKSILIDHEVYFASVGGMNDPFEGLPRYKMPTRKEIEKHLLRRGAKRKNLKKIMPKAFEDLLYNKNNWRKLNAKAADSAGIFCVTPHKDNLLMWSHYANSHDGICIGLDIKRPFDAEFGIGYEVEYQNSYPEICLLQRDLQMASVSSGVELLTEREKDELATLQFFTKSKEWEYENEVRFLRPKLAGGVGLMSFNKNQVVEVIIGCRVNQDDRNFIHKLVRENCPHASVFQANVGEAEYKLEFEACK
ncbi:DUF2971 domain-containing protein [Enterovibrio norvegicus]|uniref:DUF2971 domain-containing protein n=1 Tax=Enterovibrio norvegicus TaxID=188144 RepID=UPI000C81937A|nr:DUF2971 domain-containing protein [Enterovibrio norvegicus]PMN66099.1 hypothetical protein BCT27_24720 [Enterovibrio norvegicus]